MTTPPFLVRETEGLKAAHKSFKPRDSKSTHLRQQKSRHSKLRRLNGLQSSDEVLRAALVVKVYEPVAVLLVWLWLERRFDVLFAGFVILKWPFILVE